MKKYMLDAASKEALTPAAAVDVLCNDTLNIKTVAMDQDITFNLDSKSEPNPGDRVVFKLTSDGTARAATFGTGFTGPSVSGAINKTKVVEFVYDGTDFIAVSGAVQID